MAANWKTRCDNNHMGHFLYNNLRRRANEICQIDAATGEKETCASVLSRSIRLTQCFGKLGLVPGDPIVVSGRNHLDVHIPFYAGMMSGMPIVGIDPAFKSSELIRLLRIVKPKIAFCENAMLQEYKNAIQELGYSPDIVTFRGGENSLQNIMEAHQDLKNEDEFQVATFNTDEVYCWMSSTSGSTGMPKVVALTHSHLLQMFELAGYEEAKNGERRTALNIPTLHGISGCYNAVLMPINHIKVQTSAPVTVAHIIDIINQYKPATILAPPNIVAPILHHEKLCDLTCFDELRMGGSTVHSELLLSLKTRVRPDTDIIHGYGMTELGGLVLLSHRDDPVGSLRQFDPRFEIKCYYNDPEATNNAYTEDGYFKTGDLFYKDEKEYYYFVERLKMVFKYKNYLIVPPQIEGVILRHPGVAEVCVTGVPHSEDGEHVVACVVRRPGHDVTADDIKELVAEHFSASKHLHGGVFFVDRLPTTVNGKIDRLQVKKLALTASRV